MYADAKKVSLTIIRKLNKTLRLSAEVLIHNNFSKRIGFSFYFS